MAINIPRQPLHMQSNDVLKAAKDGNASYESFRPNHTFEPQYKEMEDRATVSEQYRVRRYPNGTLDLKWTGNQIIDAIHKLEYNGTTGDPNYGSASLLPLEVALLTVVFPAKYRMMEPQQAEILTQLSDTEKDHLTMFVEAQLKAEQNWNAGRGGGAVPGGSRNNVGG